MRTLFFALVILSPFARAEDISDLLKKAELAGLENRMEREARVYSKKHAPETDEFFLKDVLAKKLITKSLEAVLPVNDNSRRHLDFIDRILQNSGNRAADEIVENKLIPRLTEILEEHTKQRPLFFIMAHSFDGSMRDTWYEKHNETAKEKIDTKTVWTFYNHLGFPMAEILGTVGAMKDRRLDAEWKRVKTGRAMFRYMTQPTPPNGISSLTMAMAGRLAQAMEANVELFAELDEKDAELGTTPRAFFKKNDSRGDDERIPFDRYMGKGSLRYPIQRINRVLP